jgi:MYXO-CTERM domain-containing protein
VLPDGTIFVLTGAMGYWISSEDACRFDSAPDEDLRATTVVSVAARAALPDTAFAAASWPGRGPFGIFRSDDGGAAFAASALVSDGTFRYGSVHVTLGGERVYATTRTQDGIIALWRSDDRGDSWVPGDAEVEAFSGVVTGAAPGNPNRVYVEAVRAITGACEFDVALLGSSDGGDTFDTVSERNEILVGSIVREDGSIWVGWKDSGIEVSDDGVEFALLEGSPRPVGCVQPARDGDVAVCPQDDSPVLVTLRDSDTGVFEPLVTLDDITGPLDCPADTPVGRECGERWEEIAAYWGLEPGQPGEDGGTPGTDGGVSPGQDAGAADRDAGDLIVDGPTDGCSCRVGAHGDPGWLLLLLLAVVRLVCGPASQRACGSPSR